MVGRAFSQARRLHYSVLAWCDSCLRWLPHRWEGLGRCPRLHNPRIRCICSTHTCYDGRSLGLEADPEKSGRVYFD